MPNSIRVTTDRNDNQHARVAITIHDGKRAGDHTYIIGRMRKNGTGKCGQVTKTYLYSKVHFTINKVII